MGKKSRRHKPGKSSAASGQSRREAIKARRNVNSVIAPPTPPSETLRQATDRLRHFLLALSKDKWNAARIQAFWDYHCMIIDHSKTDPQDPSQLKLFANGDDKSFLKAAYKDDEELSFIRVLVLHSWAAICWANMNYEDSCYCHQVTIKICNEATDYEKRRLDSIEGYTTIARGGFNEIKAKSLYVLTEISKKNSRGDYATYGGEHCDSCGKLVEGYGVHFMACCGKCQLSYYCSRECQKNDWEHGCHNQFLKSHEAHESDRSHFGHKQSCRKKGEFKVGDTVLVADPDSPIDCWKFSHLEAPVMCASASRNTPQKWLVSAYDTETEPDGLEFSFVYSKNLRRVRSALWLPYFGKQELMAELLQKTKVDEETESEEGISDDEGESETELDEEIEELFRRLLERQG